ncbi:MAG: hypothetical protein JO061_16925, partial [Acidobacteriaceae bacterium]|nr:hypothetical protein [Acidobacteriaceae bacterium]
MRALLILAAIAAITSFQFSVYPGHTYLHSDTQIAVPQLEHLESPGLLSRDLVATHPNLTYTIYDEATRFLSHAPGVDIRSALLIQQILFRALALSGVFLLARSMGLVYGWALAVAAVLNCIGLIPGPDVAVTELEAVPHAFAFGLVLCAIGFFAQEKPLLAGLMGGLALLYDARVAAPFWIVAVVAFCVDRRARPIVQPCLTILLIFVLLLANIAQLQPAAADTRNLFERVPSPIAAVQRLRTPHLWISSWPAWQIILYMALTAIGLWAYRQIARTVPVTARWFCIGLLLLGILSVPASWLVGRFELYLLPEVQPARCLLFTVAISGFFAVVAAVKLILHRSWKAAPLIA